MSPFTTTTAAPKAGDSSPYRRDVRSPAAVSGNLALAFAENRLAEDAEHFLAVGKRDLADAESWRFLEENVGEALSRHVPQLDGHGRAARCDADHGRVPVVDRPESVRGLGGRFTDEPRAGVDHGAVQLEAPHQCAVHREPDGHG